MQAPNMTWKTSARLLSSDQTQLDDIIDKVPPFDEAEEAVQFV